MIIKHTKRMLMLCLLLAGTTFLAHGQGGAITGRVVDEQGQPLLGASVQVKELRRTASTDEDGRFALPDIANGTYTVAVTYVGYLPAEKRVSVSGAEQVADFELKPDEQFLSEVVVIGYGTQQRRDLTGSVATVSSREFQSGTITTPEQLIAGKVAGVQITSSGGRPGAGSTIRVRAGASLNASNDPLIVVDGVPLAVGEVPGVSNPLSLINPNDIETFTVLKDANATAIYGSRASNGVILITTKKGTGSRTAINFSTQHALATVDRKVDVLSADQIRDYVNANGSEAQKQLLGSANTDWQNEIYRPAYTTDNNLSIAGRAGDLPYRVSAGFLNQDGVLMSDRLQRTSAAISASPMLFNNTLKVDINLKGSHTRSRFANQDGIGASIQFDPTQPVRTDNAFGGYWEWLQYDADNDRHVPNPNAPRNPVGLIELKDDQGDAYRSFGNIQLDYALPFVEGLHANLNLGYDVSRGKGGVFIPAIAAQRFSTAGEVTRYQTDIFNRVGEFYLNYTRQLAGINGHINATAGYGYYDNKSRINNYNRTSEDGTVLSEPAFPFDEPQNRLISYYGRLIYTHADRYILSATIRTDGSSRFASENRWGVFPSVGLTWRIRDEPFLRDNRVFSDLKLRLSYGVTGQQDGIANYSYLPNYVSSANESMYQFGDTFYYMHTPLAYDRDIRWESTATYNAGIDYGFLDGRIHGSVDVYFKKTKDLLSVIPIPVGTNFSNLLLTNVGNMENRGVEWSINTTPVRGEAFTWDVGFNFTFNTNKVTNLTNVDDPNYLIEQGGITGSTGNHIQAHVVNYAPYSFRVHKQVYDQNGRPLEGVYADLNGDGTINDDDRYFYKSPLPRYLLGFTSQLEYRQFTLTTVLRANIGNYVYDNVSSNFGSRYNVLDPNGPINNAPVDFLNTGFVQKQYTSDYYIHNASFLKMDNLSLSYRIDNLLRGSGSSLTVSANVQNVFTVTKYKGVDPEISNGIDNQFYPRPRTFTLGLNLGF
ncbi:SusC/RagA family TonB-linked outer membrane protein [Parapedobacter luteus]|nr:SusC/RagA family TonB-linked outer membrane protein [Parapedobacter luteus]